MHFAKLATTATLLLVSIHPVRICLDRLAKWDFWFFRGYFKLVTSIEPLLNNIQMKFAHTGHHEFFSLRVAIKDECWIFIHNFCQGTGQFCFITTTLRGHGKSDHRSWEFNWRDNCITNSSGCFQIIHFCHGHNITGSGRIYIFSLICGYL